MIPNIENIIESIPIENFYTSGHTDVELEAYGEYNTYIIPIHIEALRTAYYGPDCVEHVRENDEFLNNNSIKIKRWLKDHFLDNLNQIEI